LLGYTLAYEKLIYGDIILKCIFSMFVTERSVGREV